MSELSDPFIAGMLFELNKEAVPAWITGLVKRPGAVAPVKSELQTGLAKLKARLTAVKPQLTQKTPMPHESFPVDRDTSHFHARMDAKRARGRIEPSLAPSV